MSAHLQCSASPNCPEEAYHKCPICKERFCDNDSEKCKHCLRIFCLDHCVYFICDNCDARQPPFSGEIKVIEDDQDLDNPQ